MVTIIFRSEQKKKKNTNIHNLFRLLHARTTIVNSVFFCLSFFPEFVPHQPSNQQEKWQETKEEQLIEMRYYLSLIQQQRMHSITAFVFIVCTPVAYKI